MDFDKKAKVLASLLRFMAPVSLKVATKDHYNRQHQPHRTSTSSQFVRIIALE